MSSPVNLSTDDMQPSASWNVVLGEAAKEVFSLMVGTEISLCPPADPPDVLEVTAMVGLAGQLCGILSVCCSKAAAATIASRMLGLSGDEATAHSSDAIGEICNMIAGSFKSKINGLEDKCMLSVPTVIIGDSYTLHSLVAGNRIEVTMLFDGSPLKLSLEVRT
jgi:chemotaxis protein CheX